MARFLRVTVQSVKIYKKRGARIMHFFFLESRSSCGPKGVRTPDLIIANDALYQLSYGPSC